MKTILQRCLATVVLLLVMSNYVTAQCTSINVNLTGDPDSIWRSSLISRNGSCCSAPPSQECISFNITLDPRTAGVWFYMTGAPALGSEYYKLNCTEQHSMRDTICLTGVGPHRITFCKPGNNANEYIIEAIAKPTFPPDDSVRIGCSRVINTYGIKPGSITWNSIYPGTTGAFNSYLSCTNCQNPSITPATNAPAYVDYVVCGDPIATMCGYSLRTCDTVRVYFFQPLSGNATPNPASFCNLGVNPGVTLTASGTGGNGVYSYIWRNSGGTIVGTGNAYYATSNQAYTVEIKDGLSNVSCPGYSVTVPVTVGSIPVVDAGADQYLCPSSPIVSLNGTITYATGGNWIGGNGTYSPGRNYVNAAYTPTPAEVAAGAVQLILESAGAGGGCPNSRDTIVIHFPSPLNVTLSAGSLSCSNSTTNITSSVTGGMLPYTYSWNTGASTTSIVGGQGTYQLIVSDALDCVGTSSLSISAPDQLSILMSSTNVSVNGGSDGIATASASGGTTPYSYNWNSIPVQNSASAINLAYGVYQVIVTDSKGCTINGSVVVNEPRCLGLNVSVTNTGLSCNGDKNATLVSSISGGAAPFLYSWNTSPAQTTSNASNLTAGSYLLTVTDNNGCVQVTYGTVTEPSQLQNTMVHTNVSVVGGNDGSATANPSGGVSPYTYTWSNSENTPTISNINANTYTVIIKDQNNCQINDTVTISEPPCNNLLIGLTKINAACSGSASGSATVYVMHGNVPYNITWSTGASTATINNLVSGSYWVKVRDAINCEEIIYFTITQPSPLSVVLSPTSVSCFGLANGSIETTVSGGTYPYMFQWDNGMSSEDLYNLFPGTYTLIVTDANACVDSFKTSVSEPAFLDVQYVTMNPTCYDSMNGYIDMSVTGGVTPYTYNWTNGATSQDIDSVGAGYYLVSVTDANGCRENKTLSILLSQPDSLVIDSAIINCPFPGTLTVSVELYASGGTGAYLYSFDNGLNYQGTGVSSFTLPIDSNYVIVLKDQNDCILPVPYALNIDTAVAIASVNFVRCHYSSGLNTNLDISPAGGDGGPYSVSIDGGLNYATPGTYSLSVPIGATYYVIVKDGKGCLSLIDTIVVPDAIIAISNVSSNYNGQPISCNGAHDGAIDLSVNGGSGSYSYLWSNGQLSQDITSLVAGIYSVIITDQNACTLKDTIGLSEPAAIISGIVVSSDFNGQHISCYGSSDGAVDLTVSGGTGAYNYVWSNSQVSEDLNGLPAGQYNVIVSDANGCVEYDTIVVNGPDKLNTLIAITTDYNGQAVSCNGNSDAGVDLTVSGGTGSYSYLWSNNAVVEDISGLGAGVYSVVVTDINNCSINDSVLIIEPPLLTGSLIVSSDYNGAQISCYGFSDGAIGLSVTGGTGGYAYAWSDSSTTRDISGVSAGTYTVWVSDANGCAWSDSINLLQPTPLTDNITIVSDYNGQSISCYNTADGALDLNIAGGTGAYTYNWSNGSNFQDLSGLTAGVYTVVISDVNSCSIRDSITMTQPMALNISLAVVSDYNGQQISCFGANDGAIDLTVSGGTGTYSYLWSTADSIQNIDGLPAGPYHVIVSDINGCQVSDTVSLIEPALLTTMLAVSSDYHGNNISCNGASDGAINLTVNGGTAPYTYSWSDSSLTEDIGNLNAGTYYIAITDINGCIKSDSIALSEPGGLVSNINAVSNYNGQNISCYGLNDGFIDLAVMGGTLPYSFTWSDSSATEDISGLQAGAYSVIVTDINGCSVEDTVTMTQPDMLIATITVSSQFNGADISCYGAGDGSVDLTVTGGTGGYSYSWSNGAATEDLSNLAAGTYNVIVLDSNTCSVNAVVSLLSPDLIETNIIITSDYNGQHISCYGQLDGALDLTVNGGTGSYTYLWSNNTYNEDLTGVGAGIYIVNVNDANGCSVLDTVMLIQPAEITSTIIITSNYNGEPISCFGLNDGAIDLTVNGGTAAYTFNWSNNQTSEDLSGLNAGSYSVSITDMNGCSDTDSITLIEPPAILSTIVITSDYNGQAISCYDATDGAVNLTATGGTGAYSYNWSNGASTEDQSALHAGTYSVNVSDINGCNSISEITLNQPALMVSDIAITSDYNGQSISCNGHNDGSVDLSVTGGTGAYSYMWSNSAITEDLNGIGVGTYSVLITDANACVLKDSVKLTGPDVMVSAIVISSNYNGQAISCYGAADGALNLSVTGGTGAYNYNWSNGAITQNISNLSTGTYTVIVSDANGCSSTDSIMLIQPVLLNSSLVVTSNFNGFNISCNGGNNGAVDLTVIGGTGTYSYQWSNNALTEDLTNIQAGTYSVNITDANNCSASNFVTLTEPALMSALISVSTSYNGYDISCFGAHDGGINLTMTNGVGSFDFSWSNGASTEDLAGVAAGNYIVNITDDNGCTLSKSIQVNQPDSLVLNSIVTNVSCNGAATGSIDINLSGGVPAYSFNWSNGEITEDIINLIAGTYQLLVSDVNGCNVSYTGNITQQQLMTISSVISNVKCFAGSDGEIDLSIDGGLSPYQFTWSNGSGNEDLNGLLVGTYHVVIKDANNCTALDTFEVSQPDSIHISLVPYQYNNGYNVSLNGAADASIDASINGGTPTYSTIWSNSGITEDLSNISAGDYELTVIDINNCEARAKIKLIEPFVLEMPTAISPNSDGKNDLFVIHGLESYPDNVIEIYNRWGNIVYSSKDYNNRWGGESNSGDQLPDATYFVVMNINNGEIILKGYVDLRR